MPPDLRTALKKCSAIYISSVFLLFVGRCRPSSVVVFGGVR